MNLISGRARLLFVIAAFNLKVIFGTAVDQIKSDNFNLTTVEIIKKYGYPAETHTTESEDGYQLTLHRIPHGKNSTEPGFPILAAHGIFSDSSQFVHSGNGSLGFFLADKGYDVWLINFRGNHYTRTHKHLPANDSKFWDFSLQEHGTFDLPAYINYICNYTKNQELFYLGYSLGTTSFLVLGSQRPEFHKNIKGAVLLAPVATIKYSKFPLKVLATFGGVLKVLSDLKSHGEFHVDLDAYQKFVELSCPSTSSASKLCEHAFFAFASGVITKSDEGRINSTHYLSSTSTKVIAHYAQLIQSGVFRQFDHGILHNMVLYNSMVPPEYNLQHITIPISVFVAPNDILATPKGVRDTLETLPSVESIYVVPDKYFGHGNFITEKESKKVLFPEIARQFENLLRGGNDSQELRLINTYKRVHGNEIYHTEDYLNCSSIKVHDRERNHLEDFFTDSRDMVHDRQYDPRGESFINTHTPDQIHFRDRQRAHLKPSVIKTQQKVYGQGNYPIEDSFINTPSENSFTDFPKNAHGKGKNSVEDSELDWMTHSQIYGSEKNPVENSFIRTPQKVPGNENYSVKNSLINTPLKVEGSEKDPLEHSFTDIPKNAHGQEEYSVEDDVIDNFLQIYASETNPVENSVIKTPQKVRGNENYPAKNSLINTPATVHGKQRNPLEDPFIQSYKTVPGKERNPLEDPFIQYHKTVPGKERNPLEDPFTQSFKTVPGKERNPLEDPFIQYHKTVPGKERNPLEDPFTQSFKTVPGKERNPLEDPFTQSYKTVPGKERNPLEDPFTQSYKTVPGKERNPLEDPFIQYYKTVPGKERNPLEDPFIQYYKTIPGKERNPPEDSFIHKTGYGSDNNPTRMYSHHNFRNPHGKNKDRMEHFSHNSRHSYGRRNDLEHYRPSLHYMY